MIKRLKLNIVLDIDNTLIHSISKAEFFKNELDKKLSRNDFFEIYFPESNETLYIIKRKYLDQFISFIFQKFNVVGVWSAGEEDYVYKIVNKLFKKYFPHFIYTKNDCKNNTKNLSDLIIYNGVDYNNRQPNVPIKGVINLSDTLIIDDIDKNGINNPNNLILIPEFTFKDLSYDVELKNLIDFLSKLDESDVRDVDKDGIFTREVE